LDGAGRVAWCPGIAVLAVQSGLGGDVMSQMMDWERIAASEPLDRTAAVVTSRTSPEVDANVAKRADLAAAIKRIDKLIQMVSPGPDRKALGRRKLELQTEVHALRMKKPGLGAQHLFSDGGKENLPRPVLHAIVKEAARRFDAQEAAAAKGDAS
jgi:hypothetical protein